MTPKTQVFFLPSKNRHLFCAYYPPDPDKTDLGDILFFPSFAEESNKSRHMITLQAQAFQKIGAGVLVLDLSGTGDSTGEFEQADWDGWIQDIQTAVNWVKRQNRSLYALWGMRLGCLLLLDFIEKTKIDIQTILFWQPLLTGNLAMTQFLRVHTASMMTGNSSETTKEIKEKLAQKEIVEIAGYRMNPALFFKIESLKMSQFQFTSAFQIKWIDVTLSENAPVPLPTKTILEQWQKDGVQVDRQTVVGPPFWSTVELATIDPLIDQTIEILTGV